METVIVRVERMAPEGEALARAEGSSRIVFVPHGVPGDHLEAELVAVKSTYARGRIKKLLESGPERIVPPCPLHFDPSRLGPACGGCDWQQLNYQAQLKYKREIISDCLQRIAKIRDAEILETLPSPRQWAYRNKVQIPFAPAPAASPRPLVAGYYQTGSRRIVDLEDCPVQPELSMRIIRKVKDLAASLGFGPPHLRHLYLRTTSQGLALAVLVTRSKIFPGRAEIVDALRASFPEIIGIHQNLQPLETSVILGPQWIRLWGAEGLKEKIGRFTFFSSPGAFLQINTPAGEILYDQALCFLKEGARELSTVLDLYCGVGTLSLWAAAAAESVIGIEENTQAARDAQRNASDNQVKNARFLAGRVESVLPRLIAQGLKEPCAVIIDPPRSGLAPGLPRHLAKPIFQRLVYVSCNPATFARDALALGRLGYRLAKVQPVDLFPQTSHVELVGLLEKQ